jgi:hypothetical protein
LAQGFQVAAESRFEEYLVEYRAMPPVLLSHLVLYPVQPRESLIHAAVHPSVVGRIPGRPSP